MTRPATLANTILLLLGLTAIASAHFVFIAPQPGGAKAQVFINEVLTPSDEVDVGIIGGAKLTLRDATGRETPLTLTRNDRAYEINLPGSGTRLVHGMVDLGLTQRGQEKPYVLIYYPRTIVGDAFDARFAADGKTQVEITPIGNPGALRLKVIAHGKPLPASEVTIILPDGTQKKLTTDEAGLTGTLTQTGRYGAWARYWEPVGGERDGKTYAETRNYATLVFDVSSSNTTTAANTVAKDESTPAVRFATMPQAASSFGAVVSDGWLYVYGGHIVPTHNYSIEAVSGQFARLHLSDAKWEQLPGGPVMQGMNLAAYKGKVYRVGGMTPRNKAGEPAATFSIADCAVFDPAEMKWQALPPLPEPRSSHDVVVIDGKLFVTGGWTLKGSQPTEWLDTLQTLDLEHPEAGWKTTKEPYRRRALIAAAFSGKVYVLGGFDEEADISHAVDIYDPATGAWTKGPDLPGHGNDGFAPAACVHNGSLYLSVADGGLYRLHESKWEKVGAATPRIAHRIASYDKSILVIGGAAKDGNSDLIEAVQVN